MSQPSVSRVRTSDGIEWHCVRQGSGPDVILIPSGEGDCEYFAKVSGALADSFTVTTFDMPGMSRTTAPESAMQDYSASKMAAQIVGLLDQLSIDQVSVWGCSSGGLAALALVADHPSRVRNAIVHEVPLSCPDPIKALKPLSPDELLEACNDVFGGVMSDAEESWRELGPEYRKRLEKNWVTWQRYYVDVVERSFSKEELTRRPVRWTIGALTPAGFFYQNVVDGFGAGIPVGLLPSKHFPQVTVPDVMAEHIRSAVKEHL
ncbi:MAG: hypothetical protein Q9191_007442 [Dirinaria sp. TL-2023a]